MSFFPPMDNARRALLRAQDDRCRERQRVQAECVCAVCGCQFGLLRAPDGEWWLFCMAKNTHHGIHRPESLTQLYRDGKLEGHPLAGKVAAGIENRRQREAVRRRIRRQGY